MKKLKILLLACLLPFATLASCNNNNQEPDTPQLVLSDTTEVNVSKTINLLNDIVTKAYDKEDGDLKDKVKIKLDESELKYDYNDETYDFTALNEGTIKISYSVEDSIQNVVNLTKEIKFVENRTETALYSGDSLFKHISSDTLKIYSSSLPSTRVTQSDQSFTLSGVNFDPAYVNNIYFEVDKNYGFIGNAKEKIELIDANGKIFYTVFRLASDNKIDHDNISISVPIPTNDKDSFVKGSGKVRVTYVGVTSEIGLTLKYFTLNLVTTNDNSKEDIFNKFNSSIITRTQDLWDESDKNHYVESLVSADESARQVTMQWQYPYGNQIPENGHQFIRVGTGISIEKNTAATLSLDLRTIGKCTEFEIFYGDITTMNESTYIGSDSPAKHGMDFFKAVDGTENEYTGKFEFQIPAQDKLISNLTFAIKTATPLIGMTSKDADDFKMTFENIDVVASSYTVIEEFYSLEKNVEVNPIGYNVKVNTTYYDGAEDVIIMSIPSVETFPYTTGFAISNLGKVDAGTYSLRLKYDMAFNKSYISKPFKSYVSINGVKQEVNFKSTSDVIGIDDSTYTYVDNIVIPTSTDLSKVEMSFENVQGSIALQIYELTLLK